MGMVISCAIFTKRSHKPLKQLYIKVWRGLWQNRILKLYSQGVIKIILTQMFARIYLKVDENSEMYMFFYFLSVGTN